MPASFLPVGMSNIDAQANPTGQGCSMLLGWLHRVRLATYVE